MLLSMSVFNIFHNDPKSRIFLLKRLNVHLQFLIVYIKLVLLDVFRNFVDHFCENLDILQRLEKLQLIFHFLFCIHRIVRYILHAEIVRDVRIEKTTPLIYTLLPFFTLNLFHQFFQSLITFNNT